MEIKKRNMNSPFREYLKFGITGVLNTGVDFTVLNALLFAFGPAVKIGFYISFKIISFVAAVINSYFLNKHWVFSAGQASQKKIDPTEGGKFLAVSLAGFAINILGSLLIFAMLQNMGTFDSHVAANIGAIVGTALVLIWNFAGYKFFVFRNLNNQPQ